ncbi:MAG: transposase [Nitrospiraceae bacterium]|uniref:transposase n=1 Tax=Nitrospira moscoviensis TaxID=42253 RepID=UPI0016515D61|nr:transposase [Nitrospiraceae bacterium]
MCDDTGKPVRLLLTTGPTSDYTGAGHLLLSLPRAQHLIADRGYDADCRCWIAS